MNNENSMNESYRLNRRDALKGVAAASLALASGAFGIPKTFGQTAVTYHTLCCDQRDTDTARCFRCFDMKFRHNSSYWGYSQYPFDTTSSGSMFSF